MSTPTPAVAHLEAQVQRLSDRADTLIEQAMRLHYAQVDLQQRIDKVLMNDQQRPRDN